VDNLGRMVMVCILTVAPTLCPKGVLTLGNKAKRGAVRSEDLSIGDTSGYETFLSFTRWQKGGKYVTGLCSCFGESRRCAGSAIARAHSSVSYFFLPLVPSRRFALRYPCVSVAFQEKCRSAERGN
jgi:hypothetical protein